MMLFFVHNLESCVFVDASRGMKNALGPQHHLQVPCLPRESDAFLNQPLTNAQSARFAFNVQQSQSCNLL
jgi:hypothetical protein